MEIEDEDRLYLARYAILKVREYVYLSLAVVVIDSISTYSKRL